MFFTAEFMFHYEKKMTFFFAIAAVTLALISEYFAISLNSGESIANSPTLLNDLASIPLFFLGGVLLIGAWVGFMKWYSYSAFAIDQEIFTGFNCVVLICKRKIQSKKLIDYFSGWLRPLKKEEVERIQLRKDNVVTEQDFPCVIKKGDLLICERKKEEGETDDDY